MSLQRDPNTIGDQPNKSKTYFIVGYVFLMAMALFWSVDDSIVYILLGIAVYFLFLGFYTSSWKNLQGPFKTAGPGRYTEAPLFSEGLKNIFQKKQGFTKTSAKESVKPSTPAANRKLVALVMFGVFAVFIIFFIGSIFGSSGAWDDSTVYFQTAEQNYWNGNYDSAYLNYRKAWKLNEGYAEAMVGYGNVLAIRKQTDSAMIMYDKALEIDPDYKEASYSKAYAHYNQEKYQQAITVLNPVLVDNPDYYDAMLLIGDAYYALKQYDEAINWYSNAYENGGSRSQALCYIMAFIFDTQGDYARAIELYKETLTYDNSIVDIHRRLGELLPNEEGDYYRAQATQLQQK